ncbi:MAG: DegV family protein [Thermomicrobiales bacterium]
MPDRIAIVTDSTADLPHDLATELGINVVPFGLRFGHELFRDGVDLTTDDLMGRIEETGRTPATSSPSPRSFADVFADLAQSHDGIVAVLMSSHLSAVVKSARIAATQFHETTPDAPPIEIVDSLNVSLGLGLQVMRAASLIRSGLPLTIVAEQLRTEVPANHLIFFLESLDLQRQRGRLGKGPEVVGTVLQLKPVLRLDEGQVIPHERVRTRARALDMLVEFAGSLPAIDEIGIIYDTTPEDVETLRDRLTAIAPDARLDTVQFGPALAAHLGPGVVGLAIRERLNG